MIEYYDYDEILLALEEPMEEEFYGTRSKFINLTTDFSFKRIFGTEVNKDLLLSFLNGVFAGRKEIKDLHYNKNEYVGDSDSMGGVVFDLTCIGSNGEQFAIEVQRTSQLNLKRRMLYYGSKIISDQAPKGRRREWDYKISEVYVIVILDGFPMPGGDGLDYIHDICLCHRDTGRVFYDEYGFIYISLVNFVKQEVELQTDFDCWLYVLKNMSKMDKLPLYMRKPIFEKLFDIAEYSNMNKEDRQMYDVSLKRKWDAYSIEQTRIILEERAKERGLQQGLQQGREQMKLETAKTMLDKGFDLEMIAELLDLSEADIERFR
ncbi:Rpn family recombination-promoting nuclease/putative transposase [Sphingobacterium faecale]|nr:Rpn family recombination-promoting nuclease/putative transposase [Sphingobacterium faecale]